MTRPASRWTILVVLCVSLLIVALDATVLHVAVPALTEDLRPGSQDLLWIVDAYPLTAASLLILFGTLGDRIGRRKVLLIGYALFGAASALAAFAPSAEVLIGARVLLGAGCAMIMPATLSILRQVFPDRRERAMAIGVWSAVAAVGAAVGPVLGGFLVEHFWWGSVFLINIPLMLVMLPLGRALLPESRGGCDGPWDVLGALSAALGVLGVVFGIKRFGGGASLMATSTYLPLLLGAALLVWFVRRQRRLRHPLIDMRMFAQAAFTTSVGCIVLAMLALVGLELIAVQYLQLVLGLSPFATGLRLLPLTFAAMAAGLAGSRLLRRLGPRRMVAGGFLLTALSVLSLTAMGQTDRPPLLTVAFVALGFGLEMTLFGAYESMLSEAPAHRSGGAAAIAETSYQLGAGHGHRAARQCDERRLQPGDAAGVGSADNAAAGQLARRGVRRRPPARRRLRRGPAACRAALLRPRDACDAAGQRRAAAVRRARGAAAAARDGVREARRAGRRSRGGPAARSRSARAPRPRGGPPPRARRAGAGPTLWTGRGLSRNVGAAAVITTASFRGRRSSHARTVRIRRTRGVPGAQGVRRT